MSEQGQLLTFARSDGQLVAFHSVATRETDEHLRFSVTEQRLDVGPGRAGPPLGGRLLEAWRRLDAFRVDDAGTVASAVTVLLETVPVGGSRSGPSSPAHSWLCQPNAWASVRSAARAQAPRVVRLLCAAGYGPEVSSVLAARDPYVAFHHGARNHAGLLALPGRFRAFLLPVLRGQPWSSVSRALALYWALDLAHDDVLLALAARILVAGRGHGLGWLARLAESEPARRLAIGRALVETGAVSFDPALLPAEALAQLQHDDEHRYADRLEYVLGGMARGIDPSHLVHGVRIAARFVPWFRPGLYDPTPRPRHPDVPARWAADLSRVVDHLAGDAGCAPSTFAFILWRWSAGAPERAAVLSRPSLLAWPAATTRRLLRALVFEQVEALTEAEQLTLAEGLLERIPASHHAKAVSALCRVLRREPRDRARLAAGLDLIARVSRPPFGAHVDGDETAAVLLDLAGTERERLARVPERSLRALDRGLADDHGACPLRQGLAALGRTRGFAFQALEAHPQPLVAAARELGLLSGPRQQALVKRFRAHAVSQRRFLRRPLDVVCRTIEGLVRRGLPNPIPRKLRLHREGSLTLSPQSLERHRQAIARRLLPFRLALLRQLALEELDRGVGTDLRDASERHALQMLGTTHPNRRLLRRVLRLPASARREFLEGHARSRAWLARHPRLDATLWARGPRLEVATGDGRPVRVEMEPDPMEVLRMGTRVGSCLSLGGICSGSAVAAMADVNKRLVVAHDERGTFVARQLVAVAEDDQLICFPVYPLGAAAAVQDAFERYDRELAGALGLALCTGGDYEVAEILSRYSYDDGIWERLLIEA